MCAPAPLAWHRNSEAIGAAKVKNMRIVNMMRRAKRKFVWVLALLGVCLAQAQPSVADSPAWAFASTLTSEFASNLRRLNPGYWADKYFGFHGEDEQIAYREGLVARSDSLMRRQHEATFGLSENPCVAGALQTFVEMPYTAIWGEDLGGEEVSWSQRAGAVGGTVLSVAGAPRVLSNVTARRAAVRAVTTQAEGGIRYPTVTAARLKALPPPTIEMEVASDGVARRVLPSARAHAGPRPRLALTQSLWAPDPVANGLISGPAQVWRWGGSYRYDYLPPTSQQAYDFINKAINDIPNRCDFKPDKKKNYTYEDTRDPNGPQAKWKVMFEGAKFSFSNQLPDNPSDWAGMTYYIRDSARGIVEYHFSYNFRTKAVVLHYFKIGGNPFANP